MLGMVWLIKIVLENVFHRHRSRALLATGNDDTDGVTLALKEANDKTSGPLRYVCLQHAAIPMLLSPHTSAKVVS